jgi:membrane fusion protein, multidrug efflux system
MEPKAKIAPMPATSRPPRRGLRRAILAVVLVLLVVVLMLWLFGAFHPKVGTQPAAIPPKPATTGTATFTVRKVRVTDSETASGKVTPVHEASIAAQIMEKIDVLNVKPGQKVKKGDVLVELNNTVLQSRLQQAKTVLIAANAAVTEAKGEALRNQQLAAKGVVSQSDLDHAQTVLKTSEATRDGAEKAVHEAEATLTFATIRAPMDGTVIDKHAEAGDMAKPGQVLVTLYDEMQVLANVRESLIGRLKEGQSIEVQIERCNLTCTGTISEIVSEGDPLARTFPVKVVGECRPEVRKGMYAKLVIPLDPIELLVIPQSAVTRVGQLDTVIVVEGGGTERRTVQLGRTLTVDKREMVQVLAGLREGEKVTDTGTVSPAPAAERKATGG